MDLMSQAQYREIQGLNQIDVTGLSVPRQRPLTLKCYLHEVRKLLQGNLPVVLVPEEMEVTLASGEADNGEMWAFTCLAGGLSVSATRGQRDYTVQHQETQVHLVDYDVHLTYFSLTRRKSRLQCNCFGDSALFCLPRALCRKVAGLLSMSTTERSEEQIENVVEEFTARLYEFHLGKQQAAQWPGASKATDCFDRIH